MLRLLLHALRLAAGVALALAMVLLILPWIAVLLANIWPNCTVNEGGGTGCMLGGRSYANELVGVMLLIWGMPLAVALALLAGAVRIVAGWVLRRDKTRATR